MQPELHLGEPQHAFLVRKREPVVAGHLNGFAAAEGKAVERRNGRAPQCLDPVKQLLAEPRDFVGPFGRIDRGKFIDVGAHDEAIVLTRMDHETVGRRRDIGLDQRVELRHHFGREHVSARVRLVDAQPDDAAAVRLRCPVL